MSDTRPPTSFLSTSTPVGKQMRQPDPKLSVICSREAGKENIFYEISKLDSFNKSDDRSRSKIENQSSSDDSLPFKGKSNQSLRERLMRQQHKKSRIPMSTRPITYNRIDSSTDDNKSDIIMNTVRSFASLNFSDKIETSPNRSGVISESPLPNNNSAKFGDKLQRIVMDSSLSSTSFNSFNNDKTGEEEHISIVPESPLGSPTKSRPDSFANTYEKSFIDDEDASKESTDGSFVSAKDASLEKPNVEEEKEDPSVIALSPITKPTILPSQKFVFNRQPMKFPLIQRKILPMLKPTTPRIPLSSTQTQAPIRGPLLIPPHTIHNKGQENVPINDPNKRLFGGKMTNNRIFNINQLTKAVLSEMHNSLATLPDETVRAETPDGLRVKLMAHQQHGLAWMLWRERQSPPSGILADDMGLGKTLAIISLILQKKNNRLNNIVDEEEQEVRKRYYQGNYCTPSHSSLIIAPASVLLQWEKEIKERVGGRLSYHIAHGATRERFSKNLARYDIVLTTYGTLTSELNPDSITSSAFANIAWERVILDEAHKIKNRKSKVSRIAANLPGLYRWCLTGTPIHNELWDLYSLIRFMKVSPFHEEAHWRNYIMCGLRNNERLNTLVKGILLRRTKAQIDAVTNKRIIDLPLRNYSVVKLEMEGVEHKCYQQMFMASRQKVQQFIQEMGNGGGMTQSKKPGAIKNPFVFGQREVSAGEHFKAMNFILVLLLRLRQACIHMCLTRQAIDLDAFKQDTEENEGLEKSVIDELERTFNNLNMTGENPSAEHNRKVEELFGYSHKTAKIQAVLSHLDKVIEKREKSVIVSQWTSVLELLEPHLRQRRVRYTTINGKIPPKERQRRVDDFNRKNGGAEVMLLSLNAGGVGLNLTGGNHLFIVDLHWNPAIENQACDRIYRVGQTKECFIHKFVVEQTIEQRVMALQTKKTQLADTVLQGAANKNLTKLTVNDLRFLFELDSRDAKKQNPIF